MKSPFKSHNNTMFIGFSLSPERIGPPYPPFGTKPTHGWLEHMPSVSTNNMYVCMYVCNVM